MMKVVLVAAALVVASGTAQAAIPAFTATCGKKIEVKAAQGGPITIKGKEAKITVEKDNYYEAALGKMTVMLTVGGDGKVSLDYVKKKKDTEKKGTCTVKA
jgi:hypothetical protein